MAQNWNPNFPHSVGLELFNQGGSTRRISGLNEMGVVFKSLASEAVAKTHIPVGGGTTSIDMVVPEVSAFIESIPDFTLRAVQSVPGAICAEIFPVSALQSNYPNILFQDFGVTAIGGVMNGETDHRYAQNDNLTGASTVGTGTVAAIGTPSDGQWLSDPAGNGHLGSSSLSFNTGTFPLTRQIVDVHFGIRANGPIGATTLRVSDDTPVGEVAPYWRSSPSRVFFDSKEFTDHNLSLGEVFVDNPTGQSELRFITPGWVRAFAAGGTRRLLIFTNSRSVGSPFVFSRIDYAVMRVYYYETEIRLAKGTVNKEGVGIFHAPSDERAGVTGDINFSKTLNQQLYLSLRQLRTGNSPAPSIVFSVPRINGTAPFSADWTVRDVVRPQQQAFRPGEESVTKRTDLFPDPEKAVPSIVMYTALDGNTVTAETQPYSATGGFIPYIVANSGEDFLTKKFANQGANTTGLQLMYVMVSDSLNPVNPITFKLRPTPGSDIGAVVVTLTPEEIAEFPVTGDATLWGAGKTLGTFPDLWELPPTVIRWRKVRIKFPSPVTFSAGGGELAIRAVPNTIPSAGSTNGYTENYLIGALLPIRRGGYLPANPLTYGATTAALNVPKTNGDIPYSPTFNPENPLAVVETRPRSDADLQVTFSKMPPVPTSVLAYMVMDDAVLPKSHIRLAWSWSAGTGLPYKRFEIERYDAITGAYHRIKNISVSTGIFDDYEARFNVASTYRIRVVRTDGVESDWTVSTVATPVLGPCRLAFSSNTDPSIDSTYVDAYAGDTSQSFTYRDGDSVSYRSVYGRDYDVAFRGKTTGGVEFSRNIIIPTAAGVRPKQNVDNALLAMTRNEDIPYVCVRDEHGNRWFASVTHTGILMTRAMGCDTPTAVASLRIVETAKTPVVVG